MKEGKSNLLLTLSHHFLLRHGDSPFYPQLIFFHIPPATEFTIKYRGWPWNWWKNVLYSLFYPPQIPIAHCKRTSATVQGPTLHFIYGQIPTIYFSLSCCKSTLVFLIFQLPPSESTVKQKLKTKWSTSLPFYNSDIKIWGLWGFQLFMLFRADHHYS